MMLSLASPAKINLFLRIVNRRNDGYHNLASLFQTISLCDIITFKQAEKDRLTSSDPSLAVDQSNLVNKALMLFRQKTGNKKCYDIHLEKRIPTSSGLGGGSSNAATTLWALNVLSGHPAKLQDLINWGAEIGSDVPFFLSKGTAYCTGRGEILRNMPPLKPYSLTIIKPHYGLSTPEVYKKVNISKLASHDPEKVLQQFYSGQQPSYFNDLEEPAFSVKPELRLLKQNLIDNGFRTVLLAGSGSSFFCIGNGKMRRLRDLSVYRVQSINRTEKEWY